MPFTYTRPTVFPDIALNDVNNGPLGGANVQEPTTLLKTNGWDWGQKPEREFFNWYGRVINNWLKYADERITSIFSSLSDLTNLAKTKNTGDADNYFRSQW